jgi:hypothetical protein
VTPVTWVRIDDHLHEHPKFKLAWELEPASVGLELFAFSYSAAFLTDGAISERFVDSWFPTAPRRRLRAVDSLVNSGLWTPNGDSWQIHDWLDYNESAAVTLERRRDREAKRRANRRKPDEGH